MRDCWDRVRIALNGCDFRCGVCKGVRDIKPELSLNFRRNYFHLSMGCS